MDINKAISQLRHLGMAIRSLAADITEEEARWKPDAESWSILEVLNHLLDDHSHFFIFHPVQGAFGIGPGAFIISGGINQLNGHH